MLGSVCVCVGVSVCGIWIHMFDKVRLIIVVLGHVICLIICGCDYRLLLFVLFVMFIKSNI